MRRSFIEWLIETCEAFVYPSQDRRWQTMCILKGTVSFIRQTRYDVKAGKWVYEEDVFDIKYILQYNNLGRTNYEIRCLRSVPDKILRNTDEFIQVVEPWVNGELSTERLKDIYADYPERLIMPQAGVVTLPPLREASLQLPYNDNLRLTKSEAVNTDDETVVATDKELAKAKIKSVREYNKKKKAVTADKKSAKNMDKMLSNLWPADPNRKEPIKPHKSWTRHVLNGDEHLVYTGSNNQWYMLTANRYLIAWTNKDHQLEAVEDPHYPTKIMVNGVDYSTSNYQVSVAA
jgi:hypothetical protein